MVHKQFCSRRELFRPIKCCIQRMSNSKSLFQIDPQKKSFTLRPLQGKWSLVITIMNILFSSCYWACLRYSWAVLADTYWCILSLLLGIVFSHFSTLRTNLQVCQSHFALQIICSFITVISKDIWKRWIYERLSCILRRPGISMTL